MKTTDTTFLDYWKQGITQMGVGALSAFDIRLQDYQQADSIEQIDLARRGTLFLLLPLLNQHQQRMLVLMASCRTPALGRELSIHSPLLDIDTLTLLPLPMQRTATGLLQTCRSGQPLYDCRAIA